VRAILARPGLHLEVPVENGDAALLHEESTAPG
jgi:hypothetical protein